VKTGDTEQVEEKKEEEKQPEAEEVKLQDQEGTDTQP
jgi:hypothetical protein